MNALMFKAYIKVVIAAAIVMLAITKGFLRPWVNKGDFPQFFHIVLDSIPNFLEALTGIPVLTSILLVFRYRGFRWFSRLKDKAIYLLSLVLGATYVITQEFKVHNLGGKNVYDPNDVIASVIGLLLIAFLMFRFGFIRNDNKFTSASGSGR